MHGAEAMKYDEDRNIKAQHTEESKTDDGVDNSLSKYRCSYSLNFSAKSVAKRNSSKDTTRQ